MNDKLLFFRPVPKETVWGGRTIKNYFNYNYFDSNTIGQVLAFVCTDKESNSCLNKDYSHLTLRDFWINHQELFCSQYADFPLIVSLVAPEKDLSIQLHPNDEIAKEEGYQYGKNEGWYFLEAEQGASIVYGQNSLSKSDLISRINNQDWEGLFKYRPVKKDDFVYIPAGFIHALGKGTVVYEIQQSTDVTYRLYDYERLDASGNKRQLHVEKALRVINSAQFAVDTSVVLDSHDILSIPGKVICNNRDFIISKLSNTKLTQMSKDKYWLCTVIKGSGWVNETTVTLGDNFLIPCGIKDFHLKGEFEMIVTQETPNPHQ